MAISAADNMHIITRSQFEITIDSEEKGFEMQNDLQSLFNDRLKTVMEEVFDKVDSEAEIIRISRLDIDLGGFTYENYQDEIPLALREKLTELLESRILSMRHSPVGNDTITSIMTSEFELLIHFLLTGTLHWGIGTKKEMAIDNLIASVLDRNPAGFSSWLRQNSHNEVMRKRFARQFREEALRLTVHLLDPVHAVIIIEFSVDIRETHRHQPLLPISNIEFGYIIWELILSYLLVDSGTFFNQKEFVNRLIHSLAVRYSIHYKSLIDLMARTIPTLLRNYPFKTSLPNIIAELQEVVNTRPLQDEEKRRKKTDPVQTSLNIVAEALRGPDQALMAKRSFLIHLKRVFDQAPARVAAILKKEGKRESVRLALIHTLTKSLITEMMHVIEPLDAGFIISYSDSLEKSQQDNPSLQVTRNDFYFITWNVILAYLLADRGTAFNRKEFLKITMHGISSRYSIEYHAFLQMLLSTTKRLKYFSPEGSGLIELLILINEEEQTVEEKRNLRAADNPAIITSFLWNLAGLTGHDNPTADTLAARFQKLMRSDPAKAKELIFREGKSEAMRKYMILHFPESLITGIVYLVEPGQESFITSYSQSLEKVQHSEAHLPLRSDDFYFIRWHYILAFLLEDRGTEFNRKQFLKVTLRQIAAHYDLKYTDLLRFLITTAIGVTGTSNSDHRLSSILLEISVEEELPNPAYQQGKLQTSTTRQEPFQQLLLFLETGAVPDDMPGYYDDIPEHVVLMRLLTINEELAGRLTSELWENKKLLEFLVRKRNPSVIIALLNLRIIPLTSNFLQLIPGIAGMDKAGFPLTGNPEGAEFLTSLIESQPVYELSRLIHLAEPTYATFAIRTMEVLMTSWQRYDGRQAGSTVYLTGWSLLVLYMATNRERLFDETHFIRYFLDYFVSVSPGRSISEISSGIRMALVDSDDPGVIKETESVYRVLKPFLDLHPEHYSSGFDWHSSVSAVGVHDRQTSDTVNPVAAVSHGNPENESREDEKQAPVPSEKDETVNEARESAGKNLEYQEGEDIFIRNSGLVLMSVFLPQLFTMLKLTSNNQFIDEAAAERAIHLLQFAAYATTDFPEHELALNRILCGFNNGQPLSREIEVAGQEISTIESLLDAMIQNWKAIGSTSLAGLRESFLQRDGQLRLVEDAWHLKIEQRGYDILLDQLPWSFSIIKHQWMDKTIYVDWI
jgi:hypothetical protein